MVGVEVVAELEVVVGSVEVDVVVCVRLEDVDALEWEPVRAKYAPPPAITMMTTTTTAMKVRAIPTLSRNKNKRRLRATLFNTREQFPELAIAHADAIKFR